MSETDGVVGLRHHRVGGTHNFRDVGGFRAGAGATRWGRLYRSDALHLVDADGVRMMRGLGVSAVVDLRTSEEREAEPSRLDDLPAVVHHVPVFETIPTTFSGMLEMYLLFVDGNGENLARVLRVVADAAGAPVLVHCTAGKDRTGLVVALALLAVGVDRDEVVADYAATDTYLRGAWTEMHRRRLAGQGVVLADDGDPLSSSPAEVIEGVIDHLDRTYGSVAAYLAAHGFGDDEVARLRAALVYDAGA